MTRHFAAALLLAGTAVLETPAQLAITEVMAEGTKSCCSPDFWELTNFGTEDIDLDGYTFTDSGDQPPVNLNPFAGLTIQGGKSVIFMRFKPGAPVRTTEGFTNWWGAENFRPTLQEVKLYDFPGLNGSVGDTIWLYDASGNVADTVTFRASVEGRSFVPNPITGILGESSLPGVNGAFQSVLCTNDVGSPGYSPPAIPVKITQEPIDQEVDASSDATFTVVAVGLPRPRYQWTHHGIAVLGETNVSLTLSNVQPDKAGDYQVVLSNAFAQVISRPAVLVVNTNCACARIVNGPSDSTIYFGQNGMFTALSRGYPAPRFQWSTNDVEIPGATDRTLVLVPPICQCLAPGVPCVSGMSRASNVRFPARPPMRRRC
jgi:hypothetical protein